MSRSNKPVMAMMLLLAMFMLGLESVQSIGICYGRLGNNLPSAAETIELYKINGVKKMRLYDADPATLEALKGSNIELILDVNSNYLEAIASDPSAAKQWVQTYVVRYTPYVKFKYIAVGNEVPPTSYMAQFVANAMHNINEAIVSANLHEYIKVSTAIDPRLLGSSYPPSTGTFRDEVKPYITPIIRLLASNGVPLLANIYPYCSYIGDTDNISLSYALFNAPSHVVQDGNLGYQNLFDAILDSMYYALEKVGGANVKIIVSETGWPSEGGVGATIDNAATYYRNLINHVNVAGTPKMGGPMGGPIETYLFAMYDENNKDGFETERHFGLFHPTNKQPKYQLSFT